MALTAAQIDAHLNALLANGRVEVGLEVGADPGLSPNEYIRIPAIMSVGIIGSAEPPHKSSPPKAPGSVIGGKTSDKGKEKEAASGRTSALGTTRTTVTNPGDSEWMMVFDREIWDAPTRDGITFQQGGVLYDVVGATPASWNLEIRSFIAVNAAHVRADEFDEDTVSKIHAIRYWAVKAGFVAGAKTAEYVEVDDPSAEARAAVPADRVQFVSGYTGQALTACVARAASWRKTNHATGGGADGIATGLPRRWMSKEGLWSKDADRTKAMAANKKHTTAFYISTHAAGVHPILALLAPEDIHHFAVIKKKYGFIRQWDVRESAKLRLTPRTQVAGAAMVTDAAEVIKMLVTEGLTPFLSNASAIAALHAAYKLVEKEGMRVAVYQGWFFNGHPDARVATRISFNQKDPATASLIGELGVVATKFYSGTTISESPALLNAASQLATASEQTKWSQLARFKTSAVSVSTLAAYGRISGASSGMLVDNMASKEQDVVTKAVTTYTDTLDAHAKLFGIDTYSKPSADLVWKNAALADERAEEIAKLAT
jgi:hypothetical protein